ncbi:MAG: cupin domain-containing protein [Pseudomonadota bacterium]|nr:cupin domain-containing protein [Pseudomonadota bacterium]
MVEKIRRVVTGHDTNGKSIFMWDDNATAVKEMESMPGLALTDLWQTNGAPANNTGNTDVTDRPVVLEPPPNGSVFRLVEFPPDTAWRDRADAIDAFDSIDAGHAPVKGSDDPMMHKTSTVDYLIVIKGEIWAILDDSEVCLKQGDTMIQRGTNHSWSVRTDEPCLLAAVLINADPI